MDRLTILKCFKNIKQALILNNIYSAVKPLFYLSKALGLAPFMYTTDKRPNSGSGIQISTFGTIHSFLMSILVIMFFIVVTKWNIENVFSKYNFIIGIVVISHSCFSSLSVIISYALCATVNRYKVMKFLALVAKVDVWLIKSNNSYKKVFLTLCSGVAMHVIMNLASYIMNFRIPPHAESDFIYFIYFLFTFMSEVIMFQFICSILLLKGRFESLNKELLSIFDAVEELPSDERVIHSQSRNLCTLTGLTEELPKHAIAVQQLDLDALVSHFSELSFDEFLHKKFEVLRLRGIHNVLCDAVELIPSMYQVPFLMSLIQIFVEIAACLCAILTHVTKLLSCQLNVPSRLNILFMLLAWGTINLLKLIAVTTSCHGATEKANHTVHLVHKFLLLRPLHPELRAELQMFSQQLLHRKLHFSVCGLFPVDFTLLYSMAGAVTTYIIILLQHSGQDIDDFMALCNRTFHTAV